MTITYYGRDVDLAVGWATVTFEKEMNTTTATAASLTITIGALASEAYVWTTPANEPNSADWPSGDFHAQIDISAIGADIVLNDADSLFGRISGDGTAALAGSTSATWDSNSGTGLKLYTKTAYNFPAGAATDRFGVEVVAKNNNDHKSQDITIQNVNTTTTYFDGPWAGAGVDHYMPSVVVRQATQRASVR
jgi:hypothetical protein